MSQAKSFTAACVQMTAGREIAPNIEMASALIREARDKGAELIVTPENTTMMEPKRAAILEKAQPEASNESLAAFRKLAAELEAWLVIGSLTVKLDGDICANRQFVIAPDGRVAARYDKIHMFDVEIPAGQSYRESATFAPGARAVVTPLPWGKLGLSICYDIRFPYLYRALAHGGADFVTAPAAFTRFTGEAHWHVLQR
ncbi:MAG: nitrilase-related carbon-nitrogen hydrolase, partial [Geminicoccales bacterium]